MSKKWLILVMTLIALLMTMPLLAACSDDDDDEDETEVVQPTKTAEPTETMESTQTVEPTGKVGECTKEEEYRVGSTSTVMGMSAEARDDSQEIAMDEINEAGGIRIGDTCVKFKYDFIDDMGTSAGAISAIQKLLYEFKADAVFYPGGMVPQILTRPYTEEEKVLSTGQPGATVQEWLGEEYPYTFHLHYDSTPELLILLDWISKNRPDIKTVHGVRLTSTIVEEIMANLDKAAMPEYGIEYTGTDWHEHAARDFYPILTSALKDDPDAIIIEYFNFPLVPKQARELGYEGTFIVAGAIPDYTFGLMTPEEINGIISLTPSMESPLVPQYYKDYKESYKERKGTYPYSIVTFPGYLTMYYFAAAIKAAGSTDPDKLKEVMETQTLTLEFPSGETLDVKLSGADIFGINHAWSPPRYLSVIENEKPAVKDVITADELDNYMATYMKYQ